NDEIFKFLIETIEMTPKLDNTNFFLNITFDAFYQEDPANMKSIAWYLHDCKTRAQKMQKDFKSE
ncbi:MAG: hypothetical protein MHPSP_001169, partial [Paramarteilia canceri]